MNVKPASHTALLTARTVPAPIADGRIIQRFRLKVTPAHRGHHYILIQSRLTEGVLETVAYPCDSCGQRLGDGHLLTARGIGLRAFVYRLGYILDAEVTPKTALTATGRPGRYLIGDEPVTVSFHRFNGDSTLLTVRADDGEKDGPLLTGSLLGAESEEQAFAYAGLIVTQATPEPAPTPEAGDPPAVIALLSDALNRAGESIGSLRAVNAPDRRLLNPPDDGFGDLLAWTERSVYFAAEDEDGRPCFDRVPRNPA